MLNPTLGSIEFNNEPLILPGSKLNPLLYKLPHKIYKSPLSLPTSGDLPAYYNLPTEFDYEEVDLPGLTIEQELELGAIPRPFVEAVRFIHSGISPTFKDGIISLDGDSTDIHHIVKRSYIKADKNHARTLLPFNGAIRGTFDLLTTPYQEDLAYNTERIGGVGHMLINLIPLEYNFHHSFVEERDYNYVLNVRMGKHNLYRFTIPELLMGFNIFNLRLRINALTRFVEEGYQKCIETIQNTEDGRVRLSKQYHLFAWQQMQLELLRIPMAAEEIEMDHPELFEVWKRALGITDEVVRLTSRRSLEQ